MSERIILEDLKIEHQGRVLVERASLTVETGRVTAVLGASGSGKSLTARAALGICDVSPGVIYGNLTYHLKDQTLRPYEKLYGRGRDERDQRFGVIRGRIASLLSQDARASLNPLWTVGRQVSTSANGDPLPWLRKANLADRVASLYPHELSGGMAQRVTIAQALARGSRFLVADEPTSALDPTIQAEILGELRRLADTGVGILLITHDLRTLPGLADEIVVFDEGCTVEQTTPERLRLGEVSHAATRRLLEATRKVSLGSIG
jgi:ABC-type glutathione transport system ATPase component